MDEYQQKRIIEILTDLVNQNLTIAERFDRLKRHDPSPEEVSRAYTIAGKTINLARELDYFPKDGLERLQRRYRGLPDIAESLA